MDPGVIIDAIWVGDYERKCNPGVAELGIVAQWTNSIFPQAVSKPQNEDDDWVVDYSKLSPLALWGVKDLRLRMKKREEEFSELKALVAAMAAEIAELRAARQG
jgi:hypothetical protein